MLRSSLLVLLLMPAVASAQASGWGSLGAVLGGSGKSSDDAYQEGRRTAAEHIAVAEEARRQQLEADSRAFDERTRARLQQWWETAGLTAAEASSIASTYKWTESETAVVAGVRGRGAATAIQPMKNALRDYNYLLANQLLVAYLVVSGEEAARSKSTASTVLPDGSR